MAGFELGCSSLWTPLNLTRFSKQIPARGGATVTNICNTICIFGGANRAQTHFDDMWLIFEKDGKLVTESADCTGDIPNCRSDHAVVAYGDKYLLLYGGKNHVTEECFSDLYIFNLSSREWKYVGEAGEELDPRCGHSLGIIECSVDNVSVTGAGVVSGVDLRKTSRFLVVFGGSNPEHGTCHNETYYAELPVDINSIDTDAFFVTWKKLSCSNVSHTLPPKREMHSTATTTSFVHYESKVNDTDTADNLSATVCLHSNEMYISGGLSMDHTDGFSDVWKLRGSPVLDITVSPPSIAISLVWTRCNDIELPTPLYGHCSGVVTTRNGGMGNLVLCVLGGITSNHCVVEDMLCADIKDPSESTSSNNGSVDVWDTVQWRNLNTKPINFRVGVCMLSMPTSLSSAFAQYMDVSENSGMKEAVGSGNGAVDVNKPSKNALKKKRQKANKLRQKEADGQTPMVAADERGADEEDQGAVVESPSPMPESVDIVLEECAVSEKVVDQSFTSNDSNSNQLLIFGGMDQMKDHNDLWLLQYDGKSGSSGNAGSTGGAYQGLISVLS